MRCKPSFLLRRRCPQRGCSFSIKQSQGYSAHIGKEVEIHYRWHALYGRPVRRFYSTKRSGNAVVLVEGEPGATVIVPAWMLDRAMCASMALGAPHVSVGALIDLHKLLMEHGFRRNYRDDDSVVQEVSNEERVTADCKLQAVAPTQHSAGF